MAELERGEFNGTPKGHAILQKDLTPSQLHRPAAFHCKAPAALQCVLLARGPRVARTPAARRTGRQARP